METGQSWLYSLGKMTSLTHSSIPTQRALHSAHPLFCVIPGIGPGQEQCLSFPLGTAGNLARAWLVVSS